MKDFNESPSNHNASSEFFSKSLGNNSSLKGSEKTYEIINYLNQKANRNFNAGTESHIILLNKLFANGYSIEEIKNVIDFKVKDWSKWNKYLRPSTLFDIANFKRYLQASYKSTAQSE